MNLVTKIIVDDVSTDLSRELRKSIDDTHYDERVLESIKRIDLFERDKPLILLGNTEDFDVKEFISFIGIGNCLRYFAGICKSYIHDIGNNGISEEIPYDIDYDGIKAKGVIRNHTREISAYFGVEDGTILSPKKVYEDFTESFNTLRDVFKKTLNNEDGYDGKITDENVEDYIELLNDCFRQVDKLDERLGIKEDEFMGGRGSR